MKSRIPRFQPRNIGEVYRWFAEIYVAGLLYHPDEPAETIVCDEGRLFTDEEAAVLNRIMHNMFSRFGDQVYEVACIYFHHAIHGAWN